MLAYRLGAPQGEGMVARTDAIHTHTGPLRILRSLYPEGAGICHNVLVHPPGGLVGGDVLQVNVSGAPGTHGLITTPGATRFYASDGPLATQRVQIDLHADARLEWLPLETICHSGTRAENHLAMRLAPGAQVMGWDITALGLPHANQPFELGQFRQHIELEGHWLERALIQACDTRLLNSPAGLAGQRCMATLYIASGSPLTRSKRQTLLDAARSLMQTSDLRSHAGATSPGDRIVAARALAPMSEPVTALLRQIRLAWRRELWNLSGASPRIWST